MVQKSRILKQGFDDKILGHVRIRWQTHPINLGCGVTAFDIDDAMLLIRRAFPDLSLQTPLDVTENIDVSTLDAGHVVPNMGNIFVRGIWWPNTS
jgi:hypothetical protein